jgi:cell shape-determining protein MreC
MTRDSFFTLFLTLLIVVMFTFGSHVGMRLQTLLAGPVPVANTGSLETLSQTVEGYGLSHTLGTSSTTKIQNGTTFPVYSRYPLNLKNEVLVAAGEKDGVKVGDTALFQGSILGSVEKVFHDSALVETIFDSRFKTPVRVGSLGVDALLVGGPEPQLTLISRNATVGENDEVYVAGAEFPYGAVVGSLRDLRNTADNIYRAATLRVFYNPASLNFVTLVPKSS